MHQHRIVTVLNIIIRDPVLNGTEPEIGSSTRCRVPDRIKMLILVIDWGRDIKIIAINPGITVPGIDVPGKIIPGIGLIVGIKTMTEETVVQTIIETRGPAIEAVAMTITTEETGPNQEDENTIKNPVIQTRNFTKDL